MSVALSRANRRYGDLRRPPALAYAFLLVLPAGCDRAPAPAPEYRPGAAGTVDHALCLLGFQAVPLRELSTGHHLVEVSVNGRKAAFVLDTGANMSVVHSARAAELGIQPGRTGEDSVAIPGARLAGRSRVEGLALGSVPIRQTSIVTADLGQLLATLSTVSGTTVHGLVGQDIMKEHRAVIDVARSLLYLMVEDRDPAPVDPSACTNDGVHESRGGAAKQ